MGPITISVEATPVLSYAMAHNEIPAISRLTVSGVTQDVRAARLRVEVADATGPLGAPQEILLDLTAGTPAVLTDLTLRLDPAAMLQVEEQRPGLIRASLQVGDVTVGAAEVRTRVLAAQQWLARPPALALELLAAHVMPNHPAIPAVLSEVADRLGAATGSPSLQGYQAGPERVDETVRAVFETMQARAIRYAEPPASWADDGQKIRTPGEVLDGRIGTCLDTVVTMAAALEQAGIRPLLFLTDGHAFLGWWREEASLGPIAELDPAGVLNRVDLGRIGLVETTAVTGPGSFADARPRIGDLLGVLDVHEARVNRIVPLPARTRDADGTVRVTVFSPAVYAPAAAATPVPAGVAPDRPPEPARVTRWKNSLLDLSLRNRLVNFTPRSALSITVPAGGAGELEDLLHSGRAIVLRASDDLGAVDRERGVRHGRELSEAQLADLLSQRHTVHVDCPLATYPTRMRGIAYRARTIVEETGANNLYLSLGTLVWELGGRPLRSPLVLVPVQLRSAGRGGPYRLLLDETGSSTPNYCLLEKLRQVHGIDVAGLAAPVTDDAGIDLAVAFAAARAAIADHDLPYRVEPTVDLAVLQFAKFRLWKDLDENWPALAGNPLVEHLIRTPTDAFADPVEVDPVPDLDGLDERCPVPADGSQLRAIADAVAGRTFVLEGPPGTGKSQTITNLLARAVADGRRVLFVAEKRAALDVVQRRLEAVGLGPLSLDLHDKGSKPTAVREQIAHALDHTVATDPAGHANDTGALQSARRALTRYAFQLHDRNAAGLSLYGAWETALAYGPEVVPMPVPDPLLTGDPERVQWLAQVFGRLPEVADAARPGPDHPWGFVDRASTVDVPAAGAAAARVDAALAGLPATAALAAAGNVGQLTALADLLESGLPLGGLDEVRTARWDAAYRSAVDRVAAFAAEPHPGLEVVTPAVLDLPLAEIDAAARAAASSGFFGRRRRLVEVRDRLAPALRPDATVAPRRLTGLTGALDGLQRAVGELAGSVTAIPGLVLPAGWSPFTDTALGPRAAEVRRLAALVDPTAGPYAVALRTDLAGSRHSADLTAPADSVGPRAAASGTPRSAVEPGPVRELADAVTALAAATGYPDLAGWAGPAGLLARWRSTAPARTPGSLARWLDLLRQLEPLRADHLDEARAALLTGRLDPDDARRSYGAGLAAASVRERRDRHGLDGFDRVTHERSIDRFGAAARAVRDQLTTVLPAQVLARRGFDPQATGGRVGELQRQLGRKRGGMRIRTLMSSYGDVITRALPCVLVSPESLARFFPAIGDLFDIVVFDEASQVRVADAVGAMGRARSVVVVGDSKQMPPTSVAESVISEEDGDEDSVVDEKSILTECVQARVHRHRLTWHYRSQDESLIAFSNLHYYDGALATFPAPGRAGTGVSLVRVDGRFDRSRTRTNPVEADAVVAEIVRRFAASPDRTPSIGVVTFNLPQRTYVEALLRDTGDPRLLEALEDPDGLFVKNLENVQGDERDVILFSTAFSPDDDGVLPLNFGPLNQSGGERRLNVAVTRARRQVIVYSSFDPEQLRTGETSSLGLRHLRTYLEMAARGPAALPANLRRRGEPDRHRDEIAAGLRRRGVELRTDVGLSGFALELVLGDNRVAVLLDGPAWSRRLTARDRDALPHEVLTGVLGWPAVARVWLPDWLSDPDAVLDRLVATLHAPAPPLPAPSLPVPTPPVPPAPTPSAPPPPGPPVPADAAGSAARTDADPTPGPDAATGTALGVRAVASTAPGPGTGARAAEEFVPWVATGSGTVAVLDALPGRAAATRVARALAAAVDAEGPVHTDRLARLVARSFGLDRVTDARRAAILRHLPPDLRRDDTEPVVWPAGPDPDTWTGFRRTPPDVERPLAHVPLREIANAMVALCGAAAGMSRDELRRSTLAVFGGRRLTTGLTERLDAALDLGLATGRLAIAGETVRPA